MSGRNQNAEQYRLVDTETGESTSFQTLAEAKEQKKNMVSLGGDPTQYKIQDIESKTVDKTEFDDMGIANDA